MGAVRGFDRRALLINRLFLRSREAEPEKGEPSHLNRKKDYVRDGLGLKARQFANQEHRGMVLHQEKDTLASGRMESFTDYIVDRTSGRHRRLDSPES